MSQISAASPKNLLKDPISWLYSLWKFSRPHTIIGTSLSVMALYLITFGTHEMQVTANLDLITKPSFILQLLTTWFACICGNIYIVGLNQLEDVAIDKINKPHLPIAAGEFSQKQAQWIIGITGILALLLAAWLGHWLLATVAVSLTIGTAYSLPPIRLKRFPFWAAICIFTVRGVIVNLGLFLHFQDKLGDTNFIPQEVWALTLFILVFTVAIAILKDVPDMEGDKQYQITTFTLLLGNQAVFNLSRNLITFCYLAMIIAGIFWLPQVNSLLMVIGHLLLLNLLWWRSQKVDLADKQEISCFYQFIWKLFFLEYLLFPVACLF